MADMQLFVEPKLIKMRPRDYQMRDHDACFKLWDAGERGTITRAATGTGKTFCACLKAATWLERGPDYRVMVISYEKQLVWQFAEEIEDFMGLTPGIEMETEKAFPFQKIIVASRASLLPAPAPEKEHIEELAKFGITELGACTRTHAERFLRHARQGKDIQEVKDEIIRLNQSEEAVGTVWSRLHKFDWRLNWLLIWDEAHKHSHRLASVGHIVDWFDQNPLSRRNGMTATPKRADGVSIGDKMFPAIAIDYPLFHTEKACALRDGWAVPYVQRHISVEGVDFKNIRMIAGDFDESELERVLGEESQLASLVEPLLDMVDNRRTLIFSPGIAMADNVAAYINARVEAVCSSCGKIKWYSKKLIGDGATCDCGTFIDSKDVRKQNMARSINGKTPPSERKSVYEAYEKDEFQFLSVVGLCREGYNSVGISCVAVFRPVSKKSSSLAEQMKGRGCRPLKGIVDGLATAEERLNAIASSAKPNCLIVDLVGITNLPDCASTAQIYADGYEDEVVQRAEKNLEEEDGNVLEALETAKAEIEDEREKVRLQREAAEQRMREEAEKRAKAQAEVRYTTSEVGVANSDPNMASDGQLKFISFLGMNISGVQLSKRKAGRMIGQLKARVELSEVARTNGIEQWSFRGPSDGQIKFMKWQHITWTGRTTPYDASQLIDAKKNPGIWHMNKIEQIAKSRNMEELTAAAKDVALCQRVIPADVYLDLVIMGKKRRGQLGGQ